MDDDEIFHLSVTADTADMARSLDDLTKRADRFGNAMSEALKGAAVKGRTFETIMGQLGQRISSIALDAALKPLTNLAAGAIGHAADGLVNGLGSLLSPAIGGAASVRPFAKGGVVSTPSYFPNAGGLGLMGEAGAEAILPLRRGADGTLGLAAPAGGQGAGGPAITFNIQTPDVEGFRRSQAQVQAMVARAAHRGQRML